MRERDSVIVDEMVREIIQSIIGSEELPDDPTVDLVSYGMSSLDIMRAAGLLSKQGQIGRAHV